MPRCMLCKASHDVQLKTDSGFTLLEILMVIVILSVTSMMVVPSFFTSSVSLDDEAKRLVQILRLAQDEAVLSGQLLRISFRPHSYAFQSVSAKNVWVAFNVAPFEGYQLSEGVQIEHVRPQPPLIEQAQEDDIEPVMAHLLFPPEGITYIADITLAHALDDRQLRIRFRPGPGGIRLFKETDVLAE